ncbi:cell wall-binding repeat-containing protein [Methanocaldococcus sp.]
MKSKISILMSMLIVFSVIPLTFATSDENVAIIVSTPADAVVAAPYAKAMGYKLIYTPTDELSDEAKKELEIYNIKKVIIVGGPVAVSNKVENEISKLNIKTERVWGETRVETSIKLFERWVKEDPNVAKNLVIAEGFNEKIYPVAVSFDAPVLYYAPNKEKEVVDALKSANVKIDDAVIIGTSVPKVIVNDVSKMSKTLLVDVDKNPENVIKSSISIVKRLNPDIIKKPIAIVVFENSKNPIINAILEFTKGYVGIIIPITTTNENIVSDIVSKVISINVNIIVLGESPTLINKIVNVIIKIAKSEGAKVSISTATEMTYSVSGGSSGGGYYIPPTTSTTTTQTTTVTLINTSSLNTTNESNITTIVNITLYNATINGSKITLNTSEGIITANVSYNPGNKTEIANEIIKNVGNETVNIGSNVVNLTEMANNNSVYPVNATLSGENIEGWLIGLWNSITQLFIGIIHAILGESSELNEVVYGNLAGNYGNIAGNLAGNYVGNLAGNLAPVNSH